jgi:hypothetical protein
MIEISSPHFDLHSSARALKGEITKRSCEPKLFLKDFIQKVFPEAGGDVRMSNSELKEVIPSFMTLSHEESSPS